MCLITQHARLKQDYQKLLIEIDDLKETNKSIKSMNDEANLENRDVHLDNAKLMKRIRELQEPILIEEIIAEKSTDMSDIEKAEYWYELSQCIFALLGKIDIPIFEIASSDWVSLAKFNYPTLTNIKIADNQFFTTSLQGLQEILSRDWTNLVPFVIDIGDCDKFGVRLYSHLCDYYKINAIVPVWGDTDQGYHGFNLAVVKDIDKFITRLIEPQTDNIFIDQGPLGRYIPRITAGELGIKKLKKEY